MTFDEDGNVVSCSMPPMRGGVRMTYDDWWFDIQPRTWADVLAHNLCRAGRATAGQFREKFPSLASTWVK